MKIWTMILVALAILLFPVTGCVPNQQVAAANLVAVSADAVLPMLVEAYLQDGYRAIKVASTEEEARTTLAVIEAKWQPVWTTWEAMRAAHGAWAEAVAAGKSGEGEAEQLAAAYCELVDLWPAAIPAVPIVPVICPKE